MEFDVIDMTEEEIENLSTVQTQLLRTAQKNKNELRYNLERDFNLFKKLLLTDGMYDSSLLTQKRAELEEEFNRSAGIIAEQLKYSLTLNEPYPGNGEGDVNTGYIVDYTLSYTERYAIVRDYYLAIPDPSERMALYTADEVAKKYLASYYSTLYDVLYTYSQ